MAIPNFGQMRELYSLQKKAKQMQKELKGLEIEAKNAAETVGVIVSGEMQVVEIEIAPSLLNEESRARLESEIKETVNQALTRARSESASRMQPLLKDLNLPGL
ncbi:MAG: YbaB/EbfC family nucleoid-associated protein [Patescibacteria group bacterium]